MSKTTAIIIGVLVLIFGGFATWSIIQSQSETIDYEQYDHTGVIEPSESNGNIGDHIRGNADSPVVFVEYADFQCAGCAASHPKVDDLIEQYGDRVAFVFRHFPIRGHQNARAAASAAESAGLQGYFFEMTATIFANQAIWSYASGSERTNIFAELFNQISTNGDVARFISDMSDANIAKKINFDYDLGAKRNKVTGTPSYFVNGELVDLSNSSTADSFMELVSAKLDAALAEHDLPTGPNAAAPEDDSDQE